MGQSKYPRYWPVGEAGKVQLASFKGRMGIADRAREAGHTGDMILLSDLRIDVCLKDGALVRAEDRNKLVPLLGAVIGVASSRDDRRFWADVEASIYPRNTLRPLPGEDWGEPGSYCVVLCIEDRTYCRWAATAIELTDWFLKCFQHYTIHVRDADCGIPYSGPN